MNLYSSFELWRWRRLWRVPWTARRSKGNQSWIFIVRTDAKAETPILLASWHEKLTHWKRPWCWERLKAGGEGDNRGWDGWVGTLTQWTWVWASSGSWWWTGRPGVLQSMGSQRVGHDWVIELKVFFLTAPYVLTGQPQNISKSEWCQVFMQGENFNSFPPRVASLSKLLINQLTLSYPLAVHHGSFSSIFTSWSPSVNRNRGEVQPWNP